MIEEVGALLAAQEDAEDIHVAREALAEYEQGETITLAELKAELA